MRRLVPALLVTAALAAAGCGGDDAGGEAVAEPSTTTSTTEAPATTEPTSTTAAPPTPSPDGGLGGFVPQPLDWEECGSGTECATLAVPLDWSAVDGATIDLALRRSPATGPADQRIGLLLFNLGGPGAPTNDSVPGGGPFDPELNERYDVVGWDPRGVGESAGLECGDAVDPFLRLDSNPDSPAEQAALDAGAAAIGAECAAEDGDLLGHMGTDDVARDLEAIRIASGEVVSYYGFSYGTMIGLRYLDLFPASALRIVIDGVLDPEFSQTDLLRGQTVGFERTMEAVFAGCPDGQADCPAGGPAAAYDRIAAAVESEPLPGAGDVLGPSDLATAGILTTYDRSFWEPFYAGLVAADEQGDGSVLLELAEVYRDFGGFTAYQAVSCLDSVNPQGSEAWAAFSDELEAISPRFGGSIANEMLACAFWPAEPRPVTGPVDGAGSNPVLVIGTTGDAATPVEQAERVAANLAEGHLLVLDGEGHTAYGDPCINDAVAAYLLDGVLPAEGARC